MVKKRSKLDSDLQMKLDIFETLERAKNMPAEGSLNVRARMRMAMSTGLRKSGVSAAQVAAGMSDLVGEEITGHQVYSWSAESRVGYRPPAEYVPAFCVATGYYEPIRIQNEAVGLFTIEGEDILLTEAGRLRKMKGEIEDALQRIDERLDRINGEDK